MTAAPETSRTACLLVRDATDRAAHHDIRRAVFVAEQGVFAENDYDAHDADPRTLHVLGLVGGVPAGTVRLFPLEVGGDPAGDWQGDRLAVLADYRTSGLGAPLVRFAVATAAAHGGRRMIAHVQPANEMFFRRLGWTRRGEPEMYVGRPHLLMDIDLQAAACG
ncbi:MSMEG_0567/Sll0786 family nitrogen starvation N-acetyltransferase [Pseudonocardia sp. H11422]|uniref:MSMEG_0567/Sll0786 family nitrogen starvation N-acetyltransferase n=1 Tax=Pseudonocardia sp. H11422 TaxID=2835866 RepID=UPI0027E3897D|nr:MSMEG_0567/Sll0786 family nitrogen starvation N-acetyltransferase [Pseudonocardia sp. H11422]